VCCYEVSEDLAADFARKFGEEFIDRSKTKPHLDLVSVAIQQMMNDGAEEIEAAHLCTKCHPELFFSYRRDGSSGRQMAFIGR
jgi:copper oxidase (laccase) domain-containing protein